MVYRTCINNHTQDEKTVYINPNNGYRACRKCRNSHNKKYREEYKKRTGVDWHVVNNNKALFDGLREQIIKRDGEQCVKCGMSRARHKEKYGRDITVDHIDGRGLNHKKDEKNNNPNNLQTLCLSCHVRKDTARRWEQYYKTIGDGNRYCKVCNSIKGLESFNKNKSNIKGYGAYCRECTSKLYKQSLLEEHK